MNKKTLQYFAYVIFFLLNISCNVNTQETPAFQSVPTAHMQQDKELSVSSPTLVTTTKVHSVPTNSTLAVVSTSETKVATVTTSATLEPTKFAPLTPVPTMTPVTATVELNLPPNWDQDDIKNVLRGNADTISELIRWAEGDMDIVLAHIKEFVLIVDPDTSHYSKEPPLWYNLTDFDGDEETELLLATPAFRINGGELMGFCGLSMCPGFMFIFEREDERYLPAYQFESFEEYYELDYPQLLIAEDINGDGITEIVISENWCGAHTCGTNLTIGVWDGEGWHNLGNVNNSYNETYIIDENQDGIKEFKSYGGTVGSTGGGLQRRQTEIYEWLDGEYKLSKTIPDSSDHPYYLVLDAHTALTNNDYDVALNLVMQVINTPEFPRNDYTLIDDWAENRIASFARIEAMLVYAKFHYRTLFGMEFM